MEAGSSARRDLRLLAAVARPGRPHRPGEDVVGTEGRGSAFKREYSRRRVNPVDLHLPQKWGKPGDDGEQPGRTHNPLVVGSSPTRPTAESAA